MRKAVLCPLVIAMEILTGASNAQVDRGPLQVPRAMHIAMKEKAHIFVGVRSGDVVGSDNKSLQSAVDYVAGLGGGMVEIGPGEFLMRDSLHLRSHVTV